MSNAVLAMRALAALLFTFSIYISLAGAQSAVTADDLIKRGVEAYRTQRYADAQLSFEKAVAAAPSNNRARLFLATTYMIQWVPGADSDENRGFRQKAKTEFLRVLDAEPENRVALASLASIAYNSAFSGTAEEKKAALEEARTWDERRVQLNVDEAEASYYLGVISWAKCFPETQALRQEAHLRPENPGPLPDSPKKTALQAACAREVDSGIDRLRRTIELDAQNDDAMSYLNLTYRLKANFASTLGEAESLIEQAQTWADRALEIKRTKAEAQHPK